MGDQASVHFKPDEASTQIISRVEYFDIAKKKKKKMIFSQVWLIRQAFDVVEDHPENFY